MLTLNQLSTGSSSIAAAFSQPLQNYNAQGKLRGKHYMHHVYVAANFSVQIHTLDEFLNFKKALHLTDDANGSPNHKTYLN